MGRFAGHRAPVRRRRFSGQRSGHLCSGHGRGRSSRVVSSGPCAARSHGGQQHLESGTLRGHPARAGRRLCPGVVPGRGNMHLRLLCGLLPVGPLAVHKPCSGRHAGPGRRRDRLDRLGHVLGRCPFRPGAQGLFCGPMAFSAAGGAQSPDETLVAPRDHAGHGPVHVGARHQRPGRRRHVLHGLWLCTGRPAGA